MERNHVHGILAIVAIVAMVGLMSGFSGCTAQESGDLAGEAFNAKSIISGGEGDNDWRGENGESPNMGSPIYHYGNVRIGDNYDDYDPIGKLEIINGEILFRTSSDGETRGRIWAGESILFLAASEGSPALEINDNGYIFASGGFNTEGIHISTNVLDVGQADIMFRDDNNQMAGKISGDSEGLLLYGGNSEQGISISQDGSINTDGYIFASGGFNTEGIHISTNVLDVGQADIMFRDDNNQMAGKIWGHDGGLNIISGQQGDDDDWSNGFRITESGDIKFNNNLHADNYCDVTGENCFEAGVVKLKQEEFGLGSCSNDELGIIRYNSETNHFYGCGNNMWKRLDTQVGEWQ